MINETRNIPTRQDLIMDSVSRFFLDHRQNLNQMLPILNQQANISLRILDYFVTNYAKNKKITYMNHGQYFNVYLQYKAQLKAFSKKQFDPFCRKMRWKNGKKYDSTIRFEYDIGKSIETTVGQLNFFKWAIQNGVLAYIVEHLTDIVDDMIETHKNRKKNDVSTNTKSSKNNKTTTNAKSKTTKSTKTTDDVSTTQKSSSVSALQTVTDKRKVKVVVSFA